MKDSLRHIDWWLLTVLLIILISGVIAIYSATTVHIGKDIYRSNDYIKQLIWIGVSLFFILLIIKTPYQVFEITIVPAYFFSLLLLVLVLFMPQIKGSSRWIVAGPIRIQPTELAKITTILFLAKILSKSGITEFQIIFRSFAIVLPPVLLILLQPDLGSSIIFWIILFGVTLQTDLPLYYILLLLSPFLTVVASFHLVAFIVLMILLTIILFKMNLSRVYIGFAVVVNTFIYFLVPFLWNNLKEYQQNRILTFLDPTRDPLGAGYQAIQSRIAIGSGMLQGKGFLEGTQKNFNFLPEQHTDFIFSVIAEEFGFIGTFAVIILFYVFLNRLIRCMKIITIKEQKLAVMGFIALFTAQITINIAINLGIFPTTGLPLPFISYGGSSMVANCIAIGIVLKYLSEKSFII